MHNYQVPEISAIRLRCLTNEIEQMDRWKCRINNRWFIMDNSKRTYMQIGLERLLDITVYLDDKLVYEGMVENAPEEVKLLKYSEVEVQGKVIYKAYSDM